MSIFYTHLYTQLLIKFALNFIQSEIGVQYSAIQLKLK